MYTPVDITGKLAETFSDARLNLCLASPLSAFMIFKVKTKFTADKIGTYNTALAYADGEDLCIWFNVDFWFNGLKNEKQRAFVLMHELKHLILKHGDRLLEKKYNRKKWNQATDYYINMSCSGITKTAVCKRYEKYLERPEFVLFDMKYRGLSSDEIYDILPDDPYAEPMDDCGVVGGNSSISDAKIDDLIRQANIHASSMSGIGVGDADFAKVIKGIIEVKVDWRSLLELQINRTYDEISTYNRVNRRSSGSVIFPSTEGEHISLVWGIDTSGSMREEDYMKVNGALMSLLSNFESWKVHIVTCDTKFNVIGTFDSDSNRRLQPEDIKLVGGGGTELSPILKYAESLEDEEEIDCIIVLTDGDIPATLVKNLDAQHILLVTRKNKTINVDGFETINIGE